MKNDDFEKAKKISASLASIDKHIKNVEDKKTAIAEFGDRCNVVEFCHEGGTINNFGLSASSFIGEDQKKIFYTECRIFREKILSMLKAEQERLKEEFESI